MVTSLAITEGAQAAMYVGGVWGTFIFYSFFFLAKKIIGKFLGSFLLYLKTQRPQSFFNVKLNTSGRTGMFIMPPLLAFTFVSESVASRLANPGAFQRKLQDVQGSSLPLWQRYANWVGQHPFQNIFIMSKTLLGLIATNFFFLRFTRSRKHF